MKLLLTLLLSVLIGSTAMAQIRPPHGLGTPGGLLNLHSILYAEDSIYSALYKNNMAEDSTPYFDVNGHLHQRIIISGGVPGGSNTQLQWNNAGVFGGTSDGVYDEQNDIFLNRYGLGYLDISQLPNTKLALKGTSIGLSDELVANNLSVNGTSWVFGAGWTYNAGSHVAVHSGSSSVLSWPGITIVGATYQIEWDQAGASGTVLLGGGGIFNGTGHQVHQITAVNTGGGNLVGFTSNSVMNVTNVSVKRVITSSLIAQGNVSFQQGLNMAIKEVAIDYNVAAEDITINAKDGCTTLNLPDGTSVGFGPGHILIFKNSSSSTITINAFSGQAIDANPSISLPATAPVMVQWTGTTWIIITPF